MSTSAPTPTPATTLPGSPTTTPTQTPVGTPDSADMNCDDSTDIDDLLVLLRAFGEIDYVQEPDCPGLGASLDGTLFGDVNCDGQFDMRATLHLLLYLAGITELSANWHACRTDLPSQWASLL